MFLSPALSLFALCSPPRVDAAQLSWEAPTSCPDTPWVEEQIAQHLGSGAELCDHSVALHAWEQDGEFVVEYEVRGPDIDERGSFTHSSCEVATEQSVVSATTWIRPVSTPANCVIERGDGFDFDSPPPEGARKSPPSFGNARRAQLHAGLNFGAALYQFGDTPAPQLHADVGVSRRRPGFGLRASVVGGGTLGQPQGDAKKLSRAWDVGVRPCAVPSLDIVELRTCASIGAGRIRTEGVSTWLWMGLDAEVGVELSPRMFVVLDLGMNLNISGNPRGQASHIWAYNRVGVEWKLRHLGGPHA